METIQFIQFSSVIQVPTVNTCPQLTSQTEDQFLCGRGEINSLIHMAWKVHVCTPNKLYLFPFNTSTNQRSTTSLSPHLLGCLVRDLNYRPWPVTVSRYVVNILYVVLVVLSGIWVENWVSFVWRG